MIQNLVRALRNMDSRIVFAALVVSLFFLNYYTKTLFFGPCGPHQWRQADCLSITKNYYEEGMNFFQPKIHFQGVKEGRAVSEFPILNYTVAALWKVFGQHEFIYRLLEYLIFIAAMFTLFNTLLNSFRSSLLAFFATGVFLTSPLLVYYSANFIADTPALSLGIISFCLFYRFYHHKKLKHFYLSLLFGTLAVLMKASALMAVSILFFFTIASLPALRRVLKTESLFEKPLLPFISLGISALLVFSWYRYALFYNDNNNNNIFLLTVLPIWEMNEPDVISNLRVLLNNLFPVFLNRPVFFIFITIALFVLSRFGRLSVFLKYAFAFTAIYFIAYLLFFFQVFSVHDYYLTNLMIFPAVTFFCFGYLLQQSDFMAQNRRFARIFILVFLVLSSFHAAAIYRYRFFENDNMLRWSPYITNEDLKLSEYLFWDYGNGIKRIEHFSPVLRQHGISRDQKVISIPDQSFNISLYFLDQKGFTVARHHLEQDTTVLERVMSRGAEFVVLSDPTLTGQRAFSRMMYRLEPMFEKDKVLVFKIKN